MLITVGRKFAKIFDSLDAVEVADVENLDDATRRKFKAYLEQMQALLNETVPQAETVE